MIGGVMRADDEGKGLLQRVYIYAMYCVDVINVGRLTTAERCFYGSLNSSPLFHGMHSNGR